MDFQVIGGDGGIFETRVDPSDIRGLITGCLGFPSSWSCLCLTTDPESGHFSFSSPETLSLQEGMRGSRSNTLR